jgi:hypothetical protein
MFWRTVNDTFRGLKVRGILSIYYFLNVIMNPITWYFFVFYSSTLMSTQYHMIRQQLLTCITAVINISLETC